MDVWVAPILNRLKGIKTKNDEILFGVNEVKGKQDGLQDVVAKESTSQEILKNILSKDNSTTGLDEMISGYINETGVRYRPSEKNMDKLLDESSEIEIATETSYSWTASYTGAVLMYTNARGSSSYYSYCVICKNGSQTNKVLLSSSGDIWNRTIQVHKGDTITITLLPAGSSSSGRRIHISKLYIAYEIVSATTLNIVRSIQQGVVDLSADVSQTITISAVDVSKVVPFVTGCTIAKINSTSLTLQRYVGSDYASTKYCHWTLVEFW